MSQTRRENRPFNDYKHINIQKCRRHFLQEHLALPELNLYNTILIETFSWQVNFRLLQGDSLNVLTFEIINAIWKMHYFIERRSVYVNTVQYKRTHPATLA